MDKKSKILIGAFIFLIFTSVALTYYRVMIKRDYIIEGQVDCDPTGETCFTYVCDPEIEECTGDPEEDTWYYKVVRKNAGRVPLCDPNDEGCEALACAENEPECETVLCTEETKGEDGECSNPETYLAEYPQDEDVSECEEDDQECMEAEDRKCAEEGTCFEVDGVIEENAESGVGSEN